MKKSQIMSKKTTDYITTNFIPKMKNIEKKYVLEIKSKMRWDSNQPIAKIVITSATKEDLKSQLLNFYSSNYFVVKYGSRINKSWNLFDLIEHIKIYCAVTIKNL